MPIVTINRGTLSGGARLADALGARLGVSVLSREVVVEAAKTYGVSEEDLQKSLRSPPGFWDKLGHKRQQYILAVQATLAGMIEQDNVVYHGLAGQLLLRDLPNVLRVRLIAPMEYRVRAAMIEHKLSRDDAEKHIEKADEVRSLWVRRVYGVDVTDPALYDLVINLGNMSMETATEMIVDLLGREEYRSTPETQQRLRDFALHMRIRAALSLRSEFSESSIEVSVRDGVVDLGVPLAAEHSRAAVVELIRQIPGVKDIRGGEGATRAEAEESILTRSWKTAADIMIPLGGYPHVRQTLPIRDALLALGASSVVSSDGHLVCPRYLLIMDEVDRLVGVGNRRNLLRGLIPQYATLKKAEASLGATIPFTDALSSTSLLWSTLFSPAAVAAAGRAVGTVMLPIRAVVSVSDTLSTVVGAMLAHDVDLIPVTDGDRTVGVIMMTDVFDNVAEYILERSAK
jgi:cytidylate kinase